MVSETHMHNASASSSPLLGSLAIPQTEGVARITQTPRTAAEVWQVLESVPDPEIPVVSIRELGILREVTQLADGTWEVVITPTYSGCPAMAQIAEDIGSALRDAGVDAFSMRTALAPAWTTDWMTDAAKEKLRAYGIAPPSQCGRASTATQTVQPLQYSAWREVSAKQDEPCCPQCGSPNTQRLAQHGSTACKALYKCLSCQEPFDYFKPY